MRFEPADYERLFTSYGLDPAARPYAALRRRLVYQEQYFEIAAALGVTEKTARDYCTDAYRQAFPPPESRRGLKTLEARVRVESSDEGTGSYTPLGPPGDGSARCDVCGAESG